VIEDFSGPSDLVRGDSNRRQTRPRGSSDLPEQNRLKELREELLKPELSRLRHESQMLEGEIF